MAQCYEQAEGLRQRDGMEREVNCNCHYLCLNYIVVTREKIT